MSLPDMTGAMRQYLRTVEAMLASGTTTEHTYRPALARTLELQGEIDRAMEELNT